MNERPSMDMSIVGNQSGEGKDGTYEWHADMSFELANENAPIEMDTDSKVLSVLEHFVEWH